MNHVVNHLVSEYSMPEGDVRKLLEGWEEHDYKVDGVVVGTAMVKGTEIHFALDKNHYKTAMRRNPMRAAIKPLFDRLGFLTTRILVGHEKQARFVERVGFVKTTSDGKFDYFFLANLPYERKQK